MQDEPSDPFESASGSGQPCRANYKMFVERSLKLQCKLYFHGSCVQSPNGLFTFCIKIPVIFPTQHDF